MTDKTCTPPAFLRGRMSAAILRRIVFCLLFFFVFYSDSVEAVLETGPGSHLAWDFSKGTAVSDSVDFRMIFVRLGSGGCLVSFSATTGGFLDIGAGVYRATGATALDDVTIASSMPSDYLSGVCADVGAVYVVRTAENHYAKFILREFDILFAYQADGSTSLDETVPVRSLTWGRVKATWHE